MGRLSFEARGDKCIHGKQKLLVCGKEILQQKRLLWLMTRFYCKAPQREGSFFSLQIEAARARESSQMTSECQCVCEFQSELLESKETQFQPRSEDQYSLRRSTKTKVCAKISFPAQHIQNYFLSLAPRRFYVPLGASPVDLETISHWLGSWHRS